MVHPGQIQAWCKQVVREFQPLKVVLFGSHAEGTATEHSDVDVLVIVPRATRKQRIDLSARIRCAVDTPFPMDVLVRSAEDIRRGLAEQDGFLMGISTGGRVLYEAKHA